MATFSPALPLSDIPEAPMQALIRAMLQYRDEFINALREPDKGEIETFWLRKTHKPVLVVRRVLSASCPGSANARASFASRPLRQRPHTSGLCRPRRPTDPPTTIALLRPPPRCC